MLFFVKSFLATQPESTRLIIWTHTPDAISEVLAKHLGWCASASSTWRKRVQMRRVEELIRTRRRIDACESDLIRFRSVEKYGGIYFDADTLIMNDMTLFCNASFAYRWSHGDRYNSAVFGCAKGCKFITEYSRGKGDDC